MPLVKNYTKTREKCRVTFKLPAEAEAGSAALVGDFNDWNESKCPMKRLKDGSFSVTITLDAGRQYRYKYLLDNTRWENDWVADSYAANEFGSEDSLVQV
jgi:1,4-alpha-glucan branching enzyme